MEKGKSQLPVDRTPENEKVSTSAPPARVLEFAPTQAHNRSYAAHLHAESEAHTRPARNLRQGSFPTGRKQP